MQMFYVTLHEATCVITTAQRWLLSGAATWTGGLRQYGRLTDIGPSAFSAICVTSAANAGIGQPYAWRHTLAEKCLAIGWAFYTPPCEVRELR